MKATCLALTAGWVSSLVSRMSGSARPLLPPRSRTASDNFRRKAVRMRCASQVKQGMNPLGADVERKDTAFSGRSSRNGTRRNADWADLRGSENQRVNTAQQPMFLYYSLFCLYTRRSAQSAFLLVPFFLAAPFPPGQSPVRQGKCRLLTP